MVRTWSMNVATCPLRIFTTPTGHTDVVSPASNRNCVVLMYPSDQFKVKSIFVPDVNVKRSLVTSNGFCQDTIL